MSPSRVAALALAITGVIIGVDVYFAVDGVVGNTWSEVIAHWATVLPIVPWAWGGLAGHFFGRRFLPGLPARLGVPLLLWLTVVLHIVCLAVHVPPLVVAVVAVPVWGVCWQA